MLRGVAKRSDTFLRCSDPKLPKTERRVFLSTFVYREYFEGTHRDDHVDDVALFFAYVQIFLLFRFLFSLFLP